VTSSFATKLPVRLAIALLQDRKGEIHIDLPVSGSLDDPKFSIWGIVWDALENLVVKAVSSPFALIGSMFGHGEQLSYLEFDPGRAVVDAAGMDKVKALAKAFTERPALRLDLTGHIDPNRDRDGLRRVLFERKVKGQKLRELSESGTAASSIDEVNVPASEWGKYLKLAYKAESFPKPRNIFGIAKDLPDAEMEKLMLTHLTVSDDDLRILAEQRAAEVKERLVKAGIAPERVYIVEPKSLAAENKDGAKASRVDLGIK
jgi:hypothetical protein